MAQFLLWELVVVINAFNDEAFVIVSDVGAFNLRDSERYKQHQIKYLYENNNILLYIKIP